MLLRMVLTGAGAALILAACGGGDPDPIGKTTGPDPRLEAPKVQTLPTIKTADPIGWAEGEAPAAPEGFTVNAFARDLNHPRQVFVMDNGDVLIAESSSEPSEGGGIRGFFERRIMGNAGALEDESPDNLILLRDTDGDGAADERHLLLDDLNQPFGIEYLDGFLYVANTDALIRVSYQPGQTEILETPERVADLPFNAGNNGHWTRNVIASPDGRTLFVAVGSVSNVADSGMAVEQNRAAIHAYDPDGSNMRLYATGLRNPVGLAINPQNGALWTAVNERDMLGDDLVPDYMTSVREGGFYGWPWSYFGQNMDPRFEREAVPMETVNGAIKPDYALGAHTASLGLTFYEGAGFPARYQGGAFIGQHGSWNRSDFAGYKVVFVPFANGEPAGEAEDFLTGFLSEDDEAHGRPVGVAVAQDGALLVTDDVGDVLWRVAPE